MIPRPISLLLLHLQNCPLIQFVKKNYFNPYDTLVTHQTDPPSVKKQNVQKPGKRFLRRQKKKLFLLLK